MNKNTAGGEEPVRTSRSDSRRNDGLVASTNGNDNTTKHRASFVHCKSAGDKTRTPPGSRRARRRTPRHATLWQVGACKMTACVRGLVKHCVAPFSTFSMKSPQKTCAGSSALLKEFVKINLYSTTLLQQAQSFNLVLLSDLTTPNRETRSM